MMAGWVWDEDDEEQSSIGEVGWRCFDEFGEDQARIHHVAGLDWSLAGR